MDIKNKENLLEYFKDKKITQIVHSDLDGIGSLLIGKYYIELIVSKFDYLITDHGFTLNDFDTDVDIIIYTDISPTKELYDEIKNKGIVQLIFDHHMTSYNNFFNLIDNFYWDINSCGTKIFFDELNKNKRTSRCISQFVELVNVFDTWQQQSLLWYDAKSLSNCMFEYKNYSSKDENNSHNIFINNQLYKFKNFKSFSFTTEEKHSIVNAEKKETKALLEAKKSLQKRVDNEGNTYIYFECMSKISLTASIIMKEYLDQDIKYYVCRSLYAFKKGMYSFSIRSPETSRINCATIAEKYKCGGHTKAAGIDFTNNKEFYFDVINGVKHLV